jgi:hypothetical protein
MKIILILKWLDMTTLSRLVLAAYPEIKWDGIERSKLVKDQAYPHLV